MRPQTVLSYHSGQVNNQIGGGLIPDKNRDELDQDTCLESALESTQIDPMLQTASAPIRTLAYDSARLEV